MTARRTCSILWAILVAIAVVSAFAGEPFGDVIVWLAALPLMAITSGRSRASNDERLDRPVVYHVAAGAVLAVALAGALCAAVPGSRDVSEVFAFYFMPIAWLAYRALVARGPSRALVVGAVAQLFSLPFLFVGALASMGCKCGPYRVPPPWTDGASLLACFTVQLMSMILVAVAIVAFQPRDPALPEARLRNGGNRPDVPVSNRGADRSATWDVEGAHVHGAK